MLALKKTGKGQRQIAVALSKYGIATKTGTAWSPQAVGAILKREGKMRQIVVAAVA